MAQSAAVIGLGAMGSPMARRLLGGNLSLTVCDRSAAALAPFASSARTTSIPAECACADAILVLVATPEQLREVVLGEGGVVGGLGVGRPVLAVMSTVPAQMLKDLAATLLPSGIRVVDAPISGGVPAAEQGTLTLMIGGDAADIDAVQPIFDRLGRHFFRCGAVGAGQTMKLINNIVCIANAAISTDAFWLAREHGLDLLDVARVLEVSTGRNYLSRDPDGPAAIFRSMASDEASFRATVSILAKDMRIAADLASRSGERYPAIREIARLVEAFDDDTYARWRRFAGLPPEAA